MADDETANGRIDILPNKSNNPDREDARWPTSQQPCLGASKSATSLLILFIPSVDRDSQPVDQKAWVDIALSVLAECFGGATAFPQARGVWRDDARGGVLVFDEPVVIQCYTREALIEQHASRLRDYLIRLGTETHQGAVGFVIDRDYLEIGFPLLSPGGE